MARLRQAPPLIASAPPRLRAAPKVALAFYQSAEWKALREDRRKDADYRAALKRCAPGERVILDHVVEIRDGGAALDPGNTQWLTHSEHQAKTERSRRQRVGLR